MTVKNTLTQAGFAALCAISLSTVVSGTANATMSTTYPGELVGVAWAPLPEGVYAVNTSSFSNDRRLGDPSSTYVDIPVIAWSTPWTFLGGRVEAYVAGPLVGAYTATRTPASGLYTTDFYNPFVAVGESWDLGHGFYVANFVGSYLPMDNFLGQDYWVPNDRFAFGYTADGWDLTAHTTFGIRTNDLNTNAGQLGAPVAGTHNYDYINEDLTATKKFGKWEVGPVGYGSWDVGSATTPGIGPQVGQFAVGGLVGYDFGGLYGQVYITHDVWIHNYTTYQTNIFGRIIIPLWNPPAAPTPLVSKY